MATFLPHSVAWLHCISVAVYGRLDVNDALNRPAYQVSTYGHPSVIAYAHLAVDGNNNTEFLMGSCASSYAATDPWWAVDLGVKLHVYGVKFTNRKHTCCGTYWQSIAVVMIIVFMYL